MRQPPFGCGRFILRMRPVGNAVPGVPRSSNKGNPPCPTYIRSGPVGGGVPDAPGSSGEIFRNDRRIRSRSPVGRADPGAPCSSARVSRNFGRIRKRFPVGKGLAPSGRERPDVRRPWANPQACSAFARDFPCRTVCCAERASPFPTMRFCEFAVGLWESRDCCGDRPRAGRRPLQGTVAYSPGIAVCLRCCCPARRVGAPYRETPAFSPGGPARPRSRSFPPGPLSGSRQTTLYFFSRCIGAARAAHRTTASTVLGSI